jgi:hypothetical protein
VQLSSSCINGGTSSAQHWYAAGDAMQFVKRLSIAEVIWLCTWSYAHHNLQAVRCHTIAYAFHVDCCLTLPHNSHCCRRDLSRLSCHTCTLSVCPQCCQVRDRSAIQLLTSLTLSDGKLAGCTHLCGNTGKL